MQSGQFPLAAGATYSISGETFTGGVTAGTPLIQLQFFNAAGASVGLSSAVSMPIGVANYVYGSLTGAAPAGAVTAQCLIGIAGGSAAVSAGGLAFRRIKIEQGSTPSLWSQEANWSAVNPSALLGKNRIINGGCAVQQRSFFTASGTGGYGGPDRYSISASNGTCVQQAGTITYGGVVRPAIVQTATVAATNLAGSNFWSGVRQFIEGYNCYDLLGQPIAISFIFMAKLPGVYTVALRDSLGTTCYVTTITVAAADTPQYYALSIPAIPAAASIPCSSAMGLQLWIGAQNVATFNTSTLNSWQSSSAVVANTAITWATTVNAYIALTDLQIEAGGVATPFDRRNMAQEIAFCQRYYQVVGLWVGIPVNTALSTFAAPLNWTPMRAVPTQTLSLTYQGGANAGTINSWQGMTVQGGALVFNAQATAGSAFGTVALNSEL
jgi:hypothetical protein